MDIAPHTAAIQFGYSFFHLRFSLSLSRNFLRFLPSLIPCLLLWLSPLVSHPLTAGNYDTWSRAMQLAITARDMFGFAEGTTPRPDDGSDPVLQTSWDWRDNLVKSWLLKSISEDIAATDIHFSSAADIWNHLRDLFGNRHPLTSNYARFYGR